MFKPLRFLLAFFLISSVACLAASGNDSAPAVNAPLNFEVNRGQTAPQVQYLARSREGVLFFTDRGVTAAVPRYGAFRMLFEGAALPEITPEQKMAARSNYLARRDGTSIINVENYGAVLYSGLYPGIDVRFYGQGRHLEHDFLLAPGADPARIVLRFEGLDQLTLNSAGEAELIIGKLHLKETAPVAWQNVSGARRTVQARWSMVGQNRLGLVLGPYDHNLPVTIDPVLVYSTHLGGATANDPEVGSTFPADTFITRIGLDSHRNIYVAGQTSAIDYPTTAGAFDRTSHDQCEFHAGCLSESGFVSKFDPTGRILIYSTYLRVTVQAMAVDSAGHVYSAEGQAIEDPGPNESQGDEGIHVDKLSVDGSSLLFTRLFATSTGAAPCQVTSGFNSFPRGMVADNSGHVWVVGSTSNPCISTPGTFQSKLPNANGSGFVAKFNTNVAPASSLTYSTYLGSSSGFLSQVDRVAIDGSGNAYVAGSTDSANFPHGASFGSGTPIMFVTKLNPTGTGVLFSTLVHAAGGFPGVAGILIDSAHDVYVAGVAFAGFPTTTGAFRRTPSGTNCQNSSGQAVPCQDGFVTKLSPGGGTLIYSTLLGGGQTDEILGLGLNSAGMAFVAGQTESSDFPTTASAFQKSKGTAASTGFITALQPDGKSLYYSTLLGGSKHSGAWTIVIDPAWNAFVGGNTQDSDFPITPDAFQPGLKGNSDGFIAKVVIAADLGATLAENTTLVARNSTVTYTERVNNFGPDGSDAVVLTDAIPSGFSFAGIVSSTASSCSAPALGATSGSVICRKTRLENGQSFSVVLKLKAIAASGSHLTNKITVSARTQDLKPANNTAQVVVAVQ